MKRIFISLLVLISFVFPSGCSSTHVQQDKEADNRIDLFVAELNADPLSAMRLNGMFPPIKLPEDTPIQKVVEEAAQNRRLLEGIITSYEIVDIREIDWKGMPGYSAALLKTNLGDKIMLIKYQGNIWGTKFFNPPMRDTKIEEFRNRQYISNQRMDFTW